MSTPKKTGPVVTIEEHRSTEVLSTAATLLVATGADIATSQGFTTAGEDFTPTVPLTSSLTSGDTDGDIVVFDSTILTTEMGHGPYDLSTVQRKRSLHFTTLESTEKQDAELSTSGDTSTVYDSSTQSEETTPLPLTTMETTELGLPDILTSGYESTTYDLSTSPEETTPSYFTTMETTEIRSSGASSSSLSTVYDMSSSEVTTSMQFANIESTETDRAEATTHSEDTTLDYNIALSTARTDIDTPPPVPVLSTSAETVSTDSALHTREEILKTTEQTPTAEASITAIRTDTTVTEELPKLLTSSKPEQTTFTDDASTGHFSTEGANIHTGKSETEQISTVSVSSSSLSTSSVTASLVSTTKEPPLMTTAKPVVTTVSGAEDTFINSAFRIVGGPGLGGGAG